MVGSCVEGKGRPGEETIGAADWVKVPEVKNWELVRSNFNNWTQESQRLLLWLWKVKRISFSWMKDLAEK